MTNLNNLSKEELITVIANMHDTIQTWNQGWGFGEEEGGKLNAIGNACTEHTSKNNSFSLDNIKVK